MVMTAHLLLVPGCEGVGAIPLPPLCACIGMSRGDLYLTRKTYLKELLGALRKTLTVIRLVQMPKALRHGQIFHPAPGHLNFW